MIGLITVKAICKLSGEPLEFKAFFKARGLNEYNQKASAISDNIYNTIAIRPTFENTGKSVITLYKSICFKDISECYEHVTKEEELTDEIQPRLDSHMLTVRIKKDMYGFPKTEVKGNMLLIVNPNILKSLTN